MVTGVPISIVFLCLIYVCLPVQATITLHGVPQNATDSIVVGVYDSAYGGCMCLMFTRVCQKHLHTQNLLRATLSETSLTFLSCVVGTYAKNNNSKLVTGGVVVSEPFTGCPGINNKQAVKGKVVLLKFSEDVSGDALGRCSVGWTRRARDVVEYGQLITRPYCTLTLTMIIRWHWGNLCDRP
jgi:hypothetical protein